MNDTVRDFLTTGKKHKALATYSESGLNVVPVSTVSVIDNDIWFFDFFMGKTVENIKKDSRYALTFWEGFEGYQVKGEAEYHSEGDTFEKAKEMALEAHPDRTLKGMLVLKVQKVYSVTPGEDSSKEI